ncbi:MAG: response regulator transcription factor [Deltaproteobacteria bacterium]|nr:response regulator transcription factor [Deltaproteobacteria bacterium]
MYCSPSSDPDGPATQRASARPSPLRRVLVVNDEMDMRPDLARELVGKLRCAVETAGSLDAALRSLGTHPPQAVIVDGSTYASCLALVRTLRAAIGSRKVVIVVLLAQHHPHDWEALRDAGADASFHQPMAAAELARGVLGLTLGQRATSEE